MSYLGKQLGKGIQGEDGPIGPQGIQGIQGIQGLKGDTGDVTLAQLNAKQDTLVSGTNIKTIGGDSILGSGDIVVGGATDYQEFTTSGTWTKPAGVNFVYVEVFGGGGGGARNTGTALAGGGAGGECIFKTFFTTDVPGSVSVVVGSGGAGVTSSGAAGIGGGYSEFGTLIKAYGGRGGNASGYVVGSFRDATYYNDFSYIYSPFFGVSGRTNEATPPSLYGGGGGASCSSTYYSGGVSEFAGNGGSSSSKDNQNTNGTFPSGGGGGTNGTSTVSGSGANGVVRVWCW